MDRLQEIEYIQRAALGDRVAAQILIDALSPALYKLASGILNDPNEAEDMVQECFMRLWPKLSNWRGEARLSTWLYRVMVNRCIDHKRKFRPQLIEIEESSLGEAEDTVTKFENKQAWQRVRVALSTLPARQASALHLCIIEGYSQKEAAKMIGVGERALESLLARGRRKLKEILGNENDNT